jgi:hypothetical protein
VRVGLKIQQEPRALMREVVMIRRPRLAKHRNTKVGPGACYASNVVPARTAEGNETSHVQRPASLRRLEVRGFLPLSRFSSKLDGGVAQDGRPKTDDDCTGAGWAGEIEATHWIGQTE